MLDLKGHTLRLRHGMSSGDLSDIIRRHNRRCGRHGTQQLVTSSVQAQRGNENYRVISTDYNTVALVALYLMPGIVMHDQSHLFSVFSYEVADIMPELSAYGIDPLKIVMWTFKELDKRSFMYNWARKMPIAYICDIRNNRYGEPRKERVVIRYGAFQQFIKATKEQAHDESSNL